MQNSMTMANVCNERFKSVPRREYGQPEINGYRSVLVLVDGCTDLVDLGTAPRDVRVTANALPLPLRPVPLARASVLSAVREEEGRVRDQLAVPL